MSQPSARTVSLTQNGIRHRMKSVALALPCATFAMTHAIGKATSRVTAVATAERMAVRTNTCQYNGSEKNV